MGPAIGASLVAQMVKNPSQSGDPWIKKIPWRREWQPTPMFLPGEFHGQRSLVAPWGCKESDTTESLLHRFLVIFKVTGYGRMHSELLL